jgi:hypothetical protein
MALEQQPFENLLNIKAGVMRLAGAERDVLQVQEHRHGYVGIVGIHFACVL